MKNQLLTFVAAVACSFATDCGHEMDKSAMKEVDGKMVCVNCAEKGDGMQTADMIDCPCGKQIAAADAVEKDGKKVCADCAKM
jgi:formylmethanofuran dehydrogenase subunit E